VSARQAKSDGSWSSACGKRCDGRNCGDCPDFCLSKNGTVPFVLAQACHRLRQCFVHFAKRLQLPAIIIPPVCLHLALNPKTPFASATSPAWGWSAPVCHTLQERIDLRLENCSRPLPKARLAIILTGEYRIDCGRARGSGRARGDCRFQNRDLHAGVELIGCVVRGAVP
jgi:hypothetical protein